MTFLDSFCREDNHGEVCHPAKQGQEDPCHTLMESIVDGLMQKLKAPNDPARSDRCSVGELHSALARESCNQRDRADGWKFEPFSQDNV